MKTVIGQHAIESLKTPATKSVIPSEGVAVTEGPDLSLPQGSAVAGSRVPHLRDGFIVAKVGIRAKLEPQSQINNELYFTR